MGLIGGLSILFTPGMAVELIGDDGLSAFVHMHKANCLFARLVHPCQRLQRSAGISLCLKG